MKRKLWVGLGALVGLLVVAAGALLILAKVKGNPSFEVADTGIKASLDPAVIAEGAYLFHGPMHCTACHDESKEAAFKRAPGSKVEPIGGMTWDLGPLGRPVSANLTSDKSTGIGGKTDEHIARVLKHGVGEDGKLRPFMALAVASMTDREAVALLSYLRTLPAKAHPVDEEHWGLMAELMIALGAIAPKHMPPARYVGIVTEPDIKRGEYLANGPALCVACHSPYDFLDGMALKGTKFSGCLAAEPGTDDPNIEVCAPNLTPDAKAGRIASWTEDEFVGRFKSGAFSSKESPMPWMNFSNISDADLRSIYRYLQSLPPAPRDPGPPVRKTGSYAMPES